MNSQLTQQLFGNNLQASFDSIKSVSNFGFSSEQFKVLSNLSESDLTSLLSVASHQGALELPKTIEIKSPDENDIAKTQMTLSAIGASLGAVCGVISIILGICAAIAGAAAGVTAGVTAVPAAVLGIISGFFALLALGIGTLIGFLTWLIIPELHSGIEFGGKGGSVFHDELDASKGNLSVFGAYPDSKASDWEIDRVDVWYGNVVDAVQTHWRGRKGTAYAGQLVSGSKYGGGGGKLQTFHLAEGEVILAIKVKAGDVVDSITFLTDRRTSDRFGGTGGNREATLEGPVMGLLGRSCELIDAIGVQKALHTHHVIAYGGNGGIPFIYNLSSMKRLIRMNVWHGDFIDAMELIWQDEDGNIVNAPMYGGYFIGGVGGTRSSIEFADGETISAIDIRSQSFVDQIAIKTSHGNEYKFGGNGGEQRPTIYLDGKKLLGIVGRYTRYVDQFGVILG